MASSVCMSGKSGGVTMSVAVTGFGVSRGDGGVAAGKAALPDGVFDEAAAAVFDASFSPMVPGGPDADSVGAAVESGWFAGSLAVTGTGDAAAAASSRFAVTGDALAGGAAGGAASLAASRSGPPAMPPPDSNAGPAAGGDVDPAAAATVYGGRASMLVTTGRRDLRDAGGATGAGVDRITGVLRGAGAAGAPASKGRAARSGG
jgi:hypothetical protein